MEIVVGFLLGLLLSRNVHRLKERKCPFESGNVGCPWLVVYTKEKLDDLLNGGNVVVFVFLKAFLESVGDIVKNYTP